MLFDVTKHDFIAAAEDIARAVPAPESQWFIARTNPRCELRVLSGLMERDIPAYTPCETRFRGRAEKKRSVQSPLLVGYVFFLLTPQHSFWEVRRVDGVHSVLLGLNGQPEVVRHSEIARFAKKEADGKFDHTRNAREAKAETEKLKANFADIQALGHSMGVAVLMSALFPEPEMEEAA